MILSSSVGYNLNYILVFKEKNSILINLQQEKMSLIYKDIVKRILLTALNLISPFRKQNFTVKVYLKLIVDWLLEWSWWHVNPYWVILYPGIRELCSLYIYVHIDTSAFCSKIMKDKCLSQCCKVWHATQDKWRRLCVCYQKFSFAYI